MKTIKTASYKETIIKIASGLSRVLDHMNSGGSFGIVSAMDDSLKTNIKGISENNKRDRLMKQMLRRFDIGFVRLKGLWKNSEAQKYLAEKSVFIPYAREEDVRTIAELFNQDSYVFGQNGKFYIKKTDGSTTYMEGKIKDYLRQLSTEEVRDITDSSPVSSLPGASFTKGRGFVFDSDKKNTIEHKPLELTV